MQGIVGGAATPMVSQFVDVRPLLDHVVWKQLGDALSASGDDSVQILFLMGLITVMMGLQGRVPTAPCANY